MRTITFRLPDEIHQGITLLAAERKVSISQLYEDISSGMLHSHVTESRFFARLAQGSRTKGLAILSTLDNYYMDDSVDLVEY